MSIRGVKNDAILRTNRQLQPQKPKNLRIWRTDFGKKKSGWAALCQDFFAITYNMSQVFYMFLQKLTLFDIGC